MAEVAKVACHPVTPVGYEVNEKSSLLATDVEAGDLLVLDGTNGWKVAPTSTVIAHGIALKKGYAGDKDGDVGIQGEMDGYTGLTPGASLYPSATTAGAMRDAAPTYYTVATTPAVVVPAPSNIRAVTATRIRYNFV